MDDPLHAALLKERYSSTWWVTPPPPEQVDTKLTQGIRRRTLVEALDEHEDTEEAS